MPRIIKRRIVPLLLAVMLFIGMIPSASAAGAEITMTDNAPSDIVTEVLPDSSLVIVPNAENEELLEGPSASDATAPGVPESADSSAAADSSSDDTTASSEVSSESTPAAPASSSPPDTSQPSDITDEISENMTSEPNSSPETEIADAEAQEQPQVSAILEGETFLSTSGGKLTIHKFPEYQWDMGLGMESVQLHSWYVMDIDGQVAYCLEPFNHNTHSDIQYGTISYGELSSDQRYAIGYIMLYGATGLNDPLFHMATQVAIWEVVEGLMNLETFESTNTRIYDATIGRNPSAASYYEQILSSVRNHIQVPSFTHFFSGLAPTHKMLGIPGEYKLDLVNTNPRCSLADFNFSDDGNVSFVKDGETLHVTASNAVSAATLFSAYKGAAGATESLVFWGAGNEQVRATAGVLDPVPCHFRLSTEDVGRYTIEITKLQMGTNIPLAGAQFEVRHTEKGIIGTYTSDGSGKVVVSVPWQGTYIVTELTPPKNHMLDENNKKEVVVSTSTPSPQVTFHNEQFSGLQITKVDAETGARISGVTFRVARRDGSEYQDVTTGESGVAVLPNLRPDWYTVTEIDCPAAYILDDTPHNIEIRDGDVTEIVLENFKKPCLLLYKYDSVSKEPLAGVTLRLEKVSGEHIGDYKTGSDGLIAVPDLEPGGYVAYEIATVPGYQLDMTPQIVQLDADGKGFLEFANTPLVGLTLLKIDSVTKAGIGGVKFLVTKLTGEEIGTFTTDDTGRIFIPDLEEQHVKVREIKAPDGYKLDTAEKIVALEVGKANTVEFENHPYPYLVIYKVGRDGQPLPGVTFKISDSAGRDLGTYTTNSAGRIVLTDIDAGRYTVQEIEPAPGFELDATPYEVTLQWGKTTQIRLNNEELGSLSLVKVSAEDETQVLPGATFLLYDAKDNLLGEYTTNENGEIFLDHQLEAGRYKLKEIRSPDGFVLDNQIREVEIESGSTVRVSWPNTPERGRIQIIKKSAEYNDTTKLPEGSPLEGAVFEIFDLNNEVLDTVTTDARGIATSKPLPLQVVGIREIQAPEYYLLNDKVIWAEIKTHGDMVKFVVENANEEIGVDVKKVGNVEAMPGDTIRYDFSDIRNESNVPLDNFYWRDILPTDAVTLRTISTGTWNSELKYTVYYKTNLSEDERVLAKDLSTGTNNTLDCSSTALGLKNGEAVTEFRFDFGTVPAGFEPVTNPYITCLVHANLANEYRFRNCTDVGGERGDEWVIDKDCWTTIVYAVPKGKLPKTGR